MILGNIRFLCKVSPLEDSISDRSHNADNFDGYFVRQTTYFEGKSGELEKIIYYEGKSRGKTSPPPLHQNGWTF